MEDDTTVYPLRVAGRNRQDSVGPLLAVVALTTAFYIFMLVAFSWAYVAAGRSLDDTMPGVPRSLVLLFFACFAAELASTGLFAWWASRMFACDPKQALAFAAVPIVIISLFYLGMMSFANGCYFGNGFPLAPRGDVNC